MASVNKQLIKGWIQYLKNNQIAGMQSNPRTGALDYKRQPTLTDLTTYLRKDYEEDEILDAVQQVLGAEQDSEQGGELATQGTRDPSTWHQSEVTPADPQDQIGHTPQQAPKKKKFNTDDAEDAKYSQRGVVPFKNGNEVRPYSNVPSTWHQNEITPGQEQDRIGGQDQISHTQQWKARPKKFNTDNAQDADVKQRNGIENDPKALPSKRKPRFKYRYKKGQLKEAIRDFQGKNLSEKEIQAIFKVLANKKPAAQPSNASVQNKTQRVQADSNSQASYDNEQDNQARVRELKRIIRDQMTDQQRAALYRALTDV